MEIDHLFYFAVKMQNTLSFFQIFKRLFSSRTILLCWSLSDDHVGLGQAPQLQEGVQELPQRKESHLPLHHLNQQQLHLQKMQHLINLKLI